eukprot:Gb_11664 [translate_table: standard]
MKHPLQNNKRKMVLSSSAMFHVQSRKTAIATKNGAFKTEKTHGNGNMSGDVRTLCKQGRLKEALGILDVMEQRGVPADFSTYASLLQECLNKKALSEGKIIDAHMTEKRFKPDLFLGNTLVNLYAKCGSLADARRVLDGMPKRNVVSWTVLIAAYAKHGLAEEALTLFYQMQRTGIQPNHFTFATVLPACASLAALEHGKEVHRQIIRSGSQSDIFVGSALVDMYVKCEDIENARQVFDKMPERNVVSWTAMIAGYAQNGYVDEAMQLFQRMPLRNVVSWNAMIAGYAQSGNVDEALKLFEKMPERDVVSWTAMISAYASNGNVDEALKLFEKMPQRDVVSWNTLIAGYAQNGRVDEALKLFQKMPQRDVVSWNALIAGYAQNGYFDEALKFFRQMQLTGVKPNSETFPSVLTACANLAALEHGKVVHEYIISSGFQFDVFVGSALVDMYAKCGSLEDACQVFDQMPRRNVVSWNAMIVGYAMHGCGKQALQLFEQMQQSATNPNHVTFVGVLSACCHAGLVDDAWHYFDCMSRYHQITPVMEHYCCMVDLLGRAGRLNDAHDFVNKMPFKPDAAVWGSLLGACRIHNNIELGEQVAERLFELDPKIAGPYVLLSNIYAAAGRWDGIERVRKMMKDRGVKKKPGCSWIEVDKQVHAFLVGDRSHPQTEKIYAKLETLAGRMKEAGYATNTRFALNDVEEEQKEHILCHHSEKLAIAFGLINTSPGTPIRIIKNLRVCGDCHCAIKLISKIDMREIIVRDAIRFHHFKDGQCSCGDYW